MLAFGTTFVFVFRSQSPESVPVRLEKLQVGHVDVVPAQVFAIVDHGPDDGDEQNEPHGGYQDHRLLHHATMPVLVIGSKGVN